MLLKIRVVVYLFLVLFVFSCKDDNLSDNEQNGKKDPVKKESPVYKNDLNFGDTNGIVGIFYVPEMLALCKIDSSNRSNLGGKMELNYSSLLADIKKIGAESNGPYGQIKYNNNPENFIFECFIPIKEVPKQQPKFGKVVVLEASAVLVYNHYGSYDKLFSSYEIIRRYLKTHQMQISGPMREFYVVTPIAGIDPNNYLAKIMVPISAEKIK